MPGAANNQVSNLTTTCFCSSGKYSGSKNRHLSADVLSAQLLDLRIVYFCCKEFLLLL